MTSSRSLVLLGCGGHARSVADVALSAGYDRLWFVDEQARDGETCLGFPVQKHHPSEQDLLYIACAGDNRRRMEQGRELAARRLSVATVISPTATIGYGAVLASGCFVGHHAHVGPLARIGAGCIINTSAVIEHDCIIGEYCHISVHATVAGRSRLGDRVFLGAGAAIIDGISVVDDVTIGAGGVVISSIEHAGTYVGVPAQGVNS